MQIAILGRQPKICLAELESLYGADNVKPLGGTAATIDTDHLDHARLGGVIKVAKALTDLDTTSWGELSSYVKTSLPKHLDLLPEGKIKLGFSVYGLKVSREQMLRTGLECKKAARAAGRSLRIVPNAAPELNSATVLHNQLTGDLGIELLFISHGGKTFLAQTTSVQDVDAYSDRDFGRPKRDAFVGMLPPKLAQTMLNLAQVQPGATVLDPFCGTGVVLQEAALLNCRVYGTDISEKMIKYTGENLNWLAEKYKKDISPKLEVADATDHLWSGGITNVVSESYLGQPLSGLPSPEKLRSIILTSNIIVEKFLKNLYNQVPKGSRHCIAVPAWRVGNNFKHLQTLDDLGKLGYNRVRFIHANSSELVYHREDQIVARELLIVTTK